jgi:N-ethylmaleimide reductase
MSQLPHLLAPLQLGDIVLRNRVVMAPMTRSRVEQGDLPGAMQVEYYRQRASAGVIISEGVHPSPTAQGYCRTPGIYSDAQVAAWRQVTAAVAERGGSMICQIMHCGRVGHADNKAAGGEFVAPSAIRCNAEIFTETGMQAMATPRALATEEIPALIEEHVQAAKNAIAAGFAGVELHGTSGYLMAQFLSSGSNQRQDQYGGSVENRVRLVVETLTAIGGAIGFGRVGLRICPGNPFNDLHDDHPEQTFAELLKQIEPLGLAYLHVIRMASTGIDNLALARAHFNGAIIGNDSYDAAEAEQAIAAGELAAVSFGRPFIANPDFVERIGSGAALNKINFKTLYTPGAAGYTDYPALA